MANPVKIKVSHANFFYGTHQALFDVSVQIRPQFVTALIGPSGCGKSTFLRSLNRMNDLIPGARLEGKVELDGEDVYSDNMDVIHLRRRVGMIFQRSNPFPMSIYDNVAYGVRVNGLAKKRVRLDAIVEKTLKGAALWDEVKDRLHRSAMSLSGGQQQRLCIARALAVEPEVLLMDEPASALDPISTAKIEELIYNLKQRLYDRHRDSQYAAGRTGIGRDRIFSDRPLGGVQRDEEAVHGPGESRNGRLHHREVRINQPCRSANTPVNTTSSSCGAERQAVADES